MCRKLVVLDDVMIYRTCKERKYGDALRLMLPSFPTTTPRC